MSQLDYNNDNLFEQEKYEEAAKKAYEEVRNEFSKLDAKRLVVSLVGNVNAGKSSTINAITGEKFAQVKAIPGWTKNIDFYELTKGVVLADTPGLEDINQDISDKAHKHIAKESDVILFFVSASEGVTKTIKEAYDKINNLNKEVIVVLSKIDTIDEDEMEEVVEYVKQQLKVEPITISTKKNIGIEKLNNVIFDLLEKKGKELLFLKISKFKEQIVSKWINGAAVAAAGIGALPIPGSDIVALTGLQMTLAYKIAYIYEANVSKEQIMALLGATVTGTVGKQIFRIAVTGLKAAGWIPGGQLLEAAVCAIASATAASVTYAFGWACNKFFKNNMQIDLKQIATFFEQQHKAFKASNKQITT